MCLYIYILLDICIYNIYIYIVGTLFQHSLETICFVFFCASNILICSSEPQFSIITDDNCRNVQLIYQMLEQKS